MEEDGEDSNLKQTQAELRRQALVQRQRKAQSLNAERRRQRQAAISAVQALQKQVRFCLYTLCAGHFAMMSWVALMSCVAVPGMQHNTLFAWADGALVTAMREGDLFLVPFATESLSLRCTSRFARPAGHHRIRL